MKKTKLKITSCEKIKRYTALYHQLVLLQKVFLSFFSFFRGNCIRSRSFTVTVENVFFERSTSFFNIQFFNIR